MQPKRKSEDDFLQQMLKKPKCNERDDTSECVSYQPNEYTQWSDIPKDDLNFKIKTQTRFGEQKFLPRVSFKGGNRNVYFQTPPMCVTHQKLFGDGDFGGKFSSTIEQANYSVELAEITVENHGDRTEQSAFIDWVIWMSLRLAQTAWDNYTANSKGWNDACDLKNNFEDLVKDMHPIYKNFEYKDVKTRYITMKKKVLDFGKNEDPMQFWSLRDKKYSVMKISSLPEGSIIQCVGFFDTWCMKQGKMYGSSIKMLPQVIVHYIPEKDICKKILLNITEEEPQITEEGPPEVNIKAKTTIPIF
jgi:hypothetical protein